MKNQVLALYLFELIATYFVFSQRLRGRMSAQGGSIQSDVGL
jgi:hypothetical protein